MKIQLFAWTVASIASLFITETELEDGALNKTKHSEEVGTEELNSFKVDRKEKLWLCYCQPQH